MSLSDELKLQRWAAADAEREQGNESGQNRDVDPAVLRWCAPNPQSFSTVHSFEQAQTFSFGNSPLFWRTAPDVFRLVSGELFLRITEPVAKDGVVAGAQRQARRDQLTFPLLEDEKLMGQEDTAKLGMVYPLQATAGMHVSVTAQMLAVERLELDDFCAGDCHEKGGIRTVIDMERSIAVTRQGIVPVGSRAAAVLVVGRHAARVGQIGFVFPGSKLREKNVHHVRARSSAAQHSSAGGRTCGRQC